MIQCLRVVVIVLYVTNNYVNGASVVHRTMEPSKGFAINANEKNMLMELFVNGDFPVSIDTLLNFRETVRMNEANQIKQYMDEMADPCEDFYRYACGNWEKIHKIPEDQPEYQALSLMQENLYYTLKELLAETSSDGVNSAEHKAKVLYSSCMNMEMRKKLGTKPLLDFLKQYGNWPALDPAWKNNEFDWISLTASLPTLSPYSLIPINIDVDWADSKANIIYINEPQLTLTNLNLYLLKSNSESINTYGQLIKDVLMVLQLPEDLAEEAAFDIITFEKELAKIVTDPKEPVDVPDLYRKITIAELMEQYSKIDWLRYFKMIFESEVTEATTVVLLARDYMSKLPEVLEKTESKTIANYILWRYIKDMMEHLDSQFEDPYNKFVHAMTGQKRSLPKWKRCIEYTNEVMGMAMGAMFVRRNFDETSKSDVIELTRELQQSFRDSLRNNTWVDQTTEDLAKRKIDAINLLVGYQNSILIPEKLNDRYNGLNIESDSFFQNTLNLARFEKARIIRTLNRPINKTDWPFNPTDINAYFEQSKNLIIIPAVILQRPLYNRLFPRALNYGALGFFIAHELIHGFDDTGRNFDINGNMKQWWTNSSIDAFKEQAECFVKQYNKYSLHGKKIDGNISKGENIADNGGIQQAYWAYNKWLEANPGQVQDESLLGLHITDRKLFFLGFAQVWCGIMRPEAIEKQLYIDEHSPGKFRVLGTLRNFEEFSRQYECPVGSGMNPAKKCKLW